MIDLVFAQVVWITGANRGIGNFWLKKTLQLFFYWLQQLMCYVFVYDWILGEALAKQFASLGAKLILSARNEAELFRIKSELKGTNFMQKSPVFNYEHSVYCDFD